MLKPNSSPNQKQKWLTTTLPSGGRINKCIKPVPAPRNDAKVKSTRSQSLDAIDGNDEDVKKIKNAYLKEGVSETNLNADNDRKNVTDQDGDIGDDTNNAKTNNSNSINKSNTCLNRSEDSSIGSTTSLNNTINSEPNPSGSNSMLNQDDTKSSSTTSSAQYSMTDNSESEPKRTLLNKYVKKVKSLMKK